MHLSLEPRHCARQQDRARAAGSRHDIIQQACVPIHTELMTGMTWREYAQHLHRIAAPSRKSVMGSASGRIQDIGPQPQSFDIERATKDKLTFESDVSDGWCVLVPAD